MPEFDDWKPEPESPRVKHAMKVTVAVTQRQLKLDKDGKPLNGWQNHCAHGILLTMECEVCDGKHD